MKNLRPRGNGDIRKHRRDGLGFVEKDAMSVAVPDSLPGKPGVPAKLLPKGGHDARFDLVGGHKPIVHRFRSYLGNRTGREAVCGADMTNAKGNVRAKATTCPACWVVINAGRAAARAKLAEIEGRSL